MLLSKYMMMQQEIVNMIVCKKMEVDIVLFLERKFRWLFNGNIINLRKTLNKKYYIFLLLVLSFNTSSIAEEKVFKGANIADSIAGRIPPGVEVIKEGDFSVLCLKSKKTINLFLKEIPVEPHVKYKLSFQSKVNNADSKLKFNPGNNKLPSWEIRILDSKGRLPYDGYLKNSWQRCFSNDWYDYQQTFYTPENGVTLQIIFSNGLEKNTLLVKNIKLERIISKNILINSGFSGGKYNYSGWNELNRAKLIETDGITKLKIEVGGYALTDPVPIKTEKYKFIGMSNIPQILFYNSDMLLIDTKQIRTKTFIPPKNAKYLRFFFHEGELKKFSLEQIKKEEK